MFGLVAVAVIAQLVLAPFAGACPMLWLGPDAVCVQCNPEGSDVPPCHREAQDEAKTETVPCHSGSTGASCCEFGAALPAATESAVPAAPVHEQTNVSHPLAAISTSVADAPLASENSEPPERDSDVAAPPLSFQKTHLRL